MSFDPTTHPLFEESNFDAYDSDRYSSLLMEGLQKHGLEPSDVVAVTQDFGLWAICTSGIFNVSRQGMFKKRVEIGQLIRYSDVTSVCEESSGTKTMRIVLMGAGSKELARIDFGAGGMENTPEIAAAHRRRIYRIVEKGAADSR